MKSAPPYISWLVYALVVAIPGVFVALRIPGPPGFVAARDLPRNHRILADDLKSAGGYHRFFGPASPAIGNFTGRYLAVAKAAGAALLPSDARAAPQLSPPPGEIALWLPLADVIVVDRDKIDAGSQVDVCGAPAGACVDDLTVAAIECAGETPPACYVGVWAPKARRAPIYAALDQAAYGGPQVIVFDSTGER